MTLFVSDLDGTLLGPKAVLSDFSRQTLRSMITEGMLFTVATARTVPSIRAILGDLSLPLPVIEHNGAYLSDLATGRHLVVHALAPEIASALMTTIREHGLAAFVATTAGDDDHLSYGELPNPAMVWYRDEKVALGDRRLRELDDPRAALAEQVIGFTLLGEGDAMLALATAIRACHAHQVQLHLHENLYCPGWWELSIQDRRATKSQAIATLRRSHALETRRLVVFGDGLNDLDMFLDADHAVAVENAVPELIAAASEIAGPHHQDGVVRWLVSHERKKRSD